MNDNNNKNKESSGSGSGSGSGSVSVSGSSSSKNTNQNSLENSNESIGIRSNTSSSQYSNNDNNNKLKKISKKFLNKILFINDDKKQEEEQETDTNWNPDHLLRLQYSEEEEKALVRKYDLHILTFVCALYLFSYLDRSNIGNANTAGMSKDLGLSDGQYKWLLTMFYIAYICFQWTTLLWKMFQPQKYIFIVVICWGLFATCQSAAQKWRDLMAMRFFLGVFEAAFGPGVPYYLTFFYYRHEIATRLGIFLVVPPIASAFSGALAYGITKHHNAIEPWRVLYIVEGLPTVLLGILCYWFIPNDSKSMGVLTDREKEIAAARTLRQIGTVNRQHKIDWKVGLKSATDFKNICCMVMFFAINVSFSSLPIYLPTIIRDMGYTSVRAQGLTAPPYLAAAMMTLLLTRLSDRIQQRGIILCGSYLVACSGYLILANVEAQYIGTRYFATFLCCCGVYPCVAILLSWVGNIQGSDGKKGFGYVMISFIGQCGPILGTRIYPASEGPEYRKGFWINFGCLATAAGVSMILKQYLLHLNKQLDEKYGKPEYSPKEMIQMLTRGGMQDQQQQQSQPPQQATESQGESPEHTTVNQIDKKNKTGSGNNIESGANSEDVEKTHDITTVPGTVVGGSFIGLDNDNNRNFRYIV